jgi:hypothetical protein
MTVAARSFVQSERPGSRPWRREPTMPRPPLAPAPRSRWVAESGARTAQPQTTGACHKRCVPSTGRMQCRRQGRVTMTRMKQGPGSPAPPVLVFTRMTLRPKHPQAEPITVVTDLTTVTDDEKQEALQWFQAHSVGADDDLGLDRDAIGVLGVCGADDDDWEEEVQLQRERERFRQRYRAEQAREWLRVTDDHFWEPAWRSVDGYCPCCLARPCCCIEPPWFPLLHFCQLHVPEDSRPSCSIGPRRFPPLLFSKLTPPRRCA